jgi:hypothetical protein
MVPPSPTTRSTGFGTVAGVDERAQVLVVLRGLGGEDGVYLVEQDGRALGLDHAEQSGRGHGQHVTALVDEQLQQLQRAGFAGPGFGDTNARRGVEAAALKAWEWAAHSATAGAWCSDA